MKKILYLVLLCCIVFSLAACGNKEDSSIKDFESTLKLSQNKGHALKTTVDELNIEQLDELSNKETTDKNKREINQLQNDINNKLVPKMTAYEDSIKNIKASSEQAKSLKKSYRKTVEQQINALKELQTFVSLCNQSIKANEDILDYTRLFEKNRSKVEKNMDNASAAGITTEVHILTKKLESNSRELKATAQKNVDTNNDKEAKAQIENDIMPLIESQIKDLNQTTISDSNVNAARKNTIEMYYSLQNYYETRKETITIGEKLDKIDYNKLPKNGKDLEQYEKPFEQELKEVE
ncbi:EMYY motif lipoprotein [Staphylococcus arlettae]|nr:MULTISPECIES: EMYY motif lipoprotein [Staphylococcus]KAB2480950.1 EMYY motif lipoprotein [Staphylococcus sp. CH99b_3]MCD8907029.1 EMYY motif lipoprotein [Staphylococcus arlettae]MEB6065913.1 EMYY motif lipoprotein [Staphylococcus arlettae]MEB7422082.1 EMYY motif lipoprotein [Staphylococcus arlettae]PTH43027.1 EMYY motif lipoprotein [Staphylococcus arlettae]